MYNRIYYQGKYITTWVGKYKAWLHYKFSELSKLEIIIINE